MKSSALGFALILFGVAGLLTFALFKPGTYSIDAASLIAERYLVSLNDANLAIDEIMEFERNFYIIYYEKTTGIGAFEMLIDKNTGYIFPEYGPNMMWNTKYGHGRMMHGWLRTPSGEMPVNREHALSIAQKFLDNVYPGALAEDPHPFYGYYTIHITKDGRIFGMLSVNGYTGEVWYHDWHGAYVQTLEKH
ncbi:MAG: hypothetical protein QW491_14380 [Thermoproteota archaeon]